MISDFPDAPASAPPWLGALRDAGRDRFGRLGLPTQREESWRFTSLGAFGKLPWQPAPATSTAISVDALPTVVAPGAAPSHRLVFVNGQWRPELSRLDSLPQGVVLTSLATALSDVPETVQAHLGQLAAVDGHALVALNTGHLGDGVVLRLPPGAILDRPIELVMAGAGGHAEAPLAWHPRLLVVAGADSRATLVEHHISLDDDGIGCANLVAELVLEAGAHLHHYQIQRENRASYHLATVSGHLADKARYEGFILALGGRLTRNEIRLVLDGPGAEAHFGCAYLIRDQQQCDTITLIDHARPHGTSRQTIKGVIDDQAHGVFQGKVLVRPDAQRTDGFQINRTLLLSDHARIDAKPELEIYADDVKCSHGATVGDLDEQALFYLRARGIDLDRARAMLIAAYVDDAIAEITDLPVRAAFEALAGGWLTTG